MTLDKFLKAWITGNEERHPSVVTIANKQRITRNILETLEAKFDHLVQVIANIASAIEDYRSLIPVPHISFIVLM